MTANPYDVPRPLILLSANSAWNIVNFRLGLARGLIADGFDVTVAAPPDGHESVLTDEPVRFIALPIDRSGMNPITDFGLFARYRRLIEEVRPAVYLGFTIKPNIYGSLAAHLSGVPVINNVSGLGTMFLGSGWKARLAHRLYRFALRRSASVFFQNPDDRDLFVGEGTVSENQAKLLPGSGVDLNRFMSKAPPDLGPVTFLFIGRLLADKGVREFVSAARKVVEKHPDVRFAILGGEDPDNRTAIPSAEIDGWRREGHVQLLGEAEDVRPHIDRSTAVVLPSYREGLPRALLEAAAMGRPMIATDVPGCRTIVEHGRNGFLCAPRDAEALADALIQMVALPVEQRMAMGRAARALVEQTYGEQNVIDAYRSAIRAIGLPSGVGKP